MADQDLDTLGSYDPGFFHIRVNTSEDILELNILLADPTKKRLVSTFLHEYIHFLQDITTTCGVWTAGRYIDMIKNVNHEIIKDGKPEFEVPFKFSNKYNVKANLDLANIYRGDDRVVVFAKYDFYSEEPVEVKTNGSTILCPKYFAHYYRANGSLGKQHFGHICLKEYVTHTIQTKFCPEVDHPDIPYTIVEQIVQREYPAFGTDPLHLVSLCDACLMALHPAQVFFKSLQQMKVEGFIPSSNDQVYDFVHKRTSFSGTKGVVSIKEAYGEVNEFSRQQLDDALATPIFWANKQWTTHILENATNLRFTDPTFMTSLVNGSGNLTTRFFEIVRIFGTPFFTNNTFSGGFIPPDSLKRLDIQAYQLLVFKEILDVFGGSRSCKLFDFCKKRPDKDITNGLCRTAPWLRGTEAELCPFGQLWKTWGLNGEVPVRKY